MAFRTPTSHKINWKPARYNYEYREMRNKKPAENSADLSFIAEREALEPMLSENIIKLQIIDNHI